MCMFVGDVGTSTMTQYRLELAVASQENTKYCSSLPDRAQRILTFRRLMSTIVDVCTANLQSCFLYIYSTNIGTEYFKHGIYSPLFPLQNAVCFIILTYLVPVLFTFYIQGVLKLKK